MNPYLLPDGNVQIAFSGGRTSAYMLHQILEANGNIPDRAVVTFQNTGREMPETLDFVQEVSNRWGVPIKWLEYAPKKKLAPGHLSLVAKHFGDLYASNFAEWWSETPESFFSLGHNSVARDGEPFLALVLTRKFLPNQQARFCTTELKIRTAKKYLQSLGWEYWTNCIGIRADEKTRLKKEGVRDGDRWMTYQPLAHAKVTKHDVALFWRRQPFDLRLINVNGSTPYGNCDGCMLKSEANLSALVRELPQRAAWWEAMESLARELTAGSGGTFSKRYSRAGMRQFIEAQGDWIFDAPGVLCQASDGECTG